MSISPDEILLLDGATGTELDRMGVDLSMPLWSARAMDEAPEKLASVHKAYLQAGAGAIVTNTFRTHARSLAKGGLGSQASRLTHAAVAIARQAIQDSNSSALLLGSVAPLEDCYSPELSPDYKTCQIEHGKLMTDLVEAGVDFILIETMCTAHESRAAAKVAAEIAPGRWGLSLCLAQEDEIGVLQDGQMLVDLIPDLHEASFIGINCVAASGMEDQIVHLRSCLSNSIPIMAYGNVGYADHEGGWVSTDAIEPTQYAKYVMKWIERGASIVGGCCGTTPATISAIRSLLDDEASQLPNTRFSDQSANRND